MGTVTVCLVHINMYQNLKKKITKANLFGPISFIQIEIGCLGNKLWIIDHLYVTLTKNFRVSFFKIRLYDIYYPWCDPTTHELWCLFNLLWNHLFHELVVFGTIIQMHEYIALVWIATYFNTAMVTLGWSSVFL